MGTLVAALLSLAPKLILPTLRAAEAIFGPKTGEVKMESVIEALKPILERAAKAGKIPGIPDEATLKAVIESVFQSDKSAIEATDAPEPKDGFTSLTIPPGSKITIELPAAEALEVTPE